MFITIIIEKLLRNGEKKMIIENILNYCEGERLSIKQFEEKCNLANGLVGKWKSGVAVPSMPTLNKIVKATGVGFDYWLKENNGE